jgi:hypothetical protein
MNGSGQNEGKRHFRLKNALFSVLILLFYSFCTNHTGTLAELNDILHKVEKITILYIIIQLQTVIDNIEQNMLSNFVCFINEQTTLVLFLFTYLEPFKIFIFQIRIRICQYSISQSLSIFRPLKFPPQ